MSPRAKKSKPSRPGRRAVKKGRRNFEYRKPYNFGPEHEQA